VTADDAIIRRFLERVQGIEWDEEKAAINRRKHGIDFDDAVAVFYGANVLRRSDRNKEERWIAIGESEGRLIAVVFTLRGNDLRIISARRARRNERRHYDQETMGRTPQGQD
jgi:hypothetical protein